MTGQDGGFRAARARFTAEVSAALTRARRATGEAKAQSGDFRKRNQELTEQAKTGRLRGVHRGQVEPTTVEPRDEAAKFRDANGLPVPELPDADRLMARLPAEPVAEPEPRPDDDDFSQHQLLVDLDDAPDESVGEGPADTSEGGPDRAGTESPAKENTRPSDENEDFSQQRILMDATVESYRPEAFPDSVFELSDEQTPS
ncbi:MAG: hypothetical protein GEV28_39195 [Actinophytocola sp.]|uniref:hypothetical protein n=1 Tax=Actinophytocola sp. TaxID=1872138 RepID=UPI0013274763|nr:hypothetical protein [Actinophytocola sp.]MPZ86078.1 hypothetical protein [Actinophytocola sp.]